MANQKYEAFLHVAETGSFKQAAHDLGYTQAGISYLISSIEKELGIPLFVRDYGGAHLTNEGRDLLPWFRNVCNDERQLASRISELKNLESGVVRVAAFTSVSIQWFPGIAKTFMAKHPGIDLQLVCLDNEDELEQAVWSGDVDCGFFVFPIKQQLEAFSLYHDPLMVLLPPNHALANARSVPARTLGEEPYIRLQNGSLSEMDAVFSNNRVEPHVRFTINNDYAVMSMVSTGLGFSVLPSLLLDTTPFPVAVVPPQKETHREIAIAVRSMDTASAATRAFVETTRTWVAKRYEAKA